LLFLSSYAIIYQPNPPKNPDTLSAITPTASSKSS
jgi:hypothetical protein